MTNHALRGAEASARVAGNVRAEMARKSLTIAQLAVVLGVTPHTAGRRYNGKVAFSAPEVVNVATWLSVDVSKLFLATAEIKVAS